MAYGEGTAHRKDSSRSKLSAADRCGMEHIASAWMSNKTVAGKANRRQKAITMKRCPNAYGIWGWAEVFVTGDWYDNKMVSRTAGGGSWFHSDDTFRRASFRMAVGPQLRFNDFSFRVVLSNDAQNQQASEQQAAESGVVNSDFEWCSLSNTLATKLKRSFAPHCFLQRTNSVLVRVLDDLYLRHSDQSLGDHFIEEWQQSLNFVIRINDAHHHRSIVGKR